MALQLGECPSEWAGSRENIRQGRADGKKRAESKPSRSVISHIAELEVSAMCVIHVFLFPHFNCLMYLSWFLKPFKRCIAEWFYFNFLIIIISQLFKKLYRYFGNVSSFPGYSITKHIFFPQRKSRCLQAASYRIFFSDMKRIFSINDAILALTNSGYVN